MSGLRLLALLALGLTLSPEWADAQDDRLRARLDPATARAVQAVIDRAAGEGLPTEPLVLKALEGASKNARGAQIAAVVGRLQAQLGIARSAIGSESSDAEIVAAAGAVQAGVDPQVLRSIRAARPTGSVATALSVLTDLVARGVPADGASSSIMEMLKSGTPDDRLLQYGRDVQREIAAGKAPPPAAVTPSRPGGPGGIPVMPGKPPAQKGQGAGRPPL